MIWFEDNEAKRAQANEVTFRPRRRNEVELSLITTERKVKWFGTKWNEIKWASLNWNEMGYGRKWSEIKELKVETSAWKVDKQRMGKTGSYLVKKKVLVWIQYLGNGKSKMRKKKASGILDESWRSDIMTHIQKVRCHSIWHIVWRKLWYVAWPLFDILSDVYSDILPDI